MARGYAAKAETRRKGALGAAVVVLAAAAALAVVAAASDTEDSHTSDTEDSHTSDTEDTQTSDTEDTHTSAEKKEKKRKKKDREKRQRKQEDLAGEGKGSADAAAGLIDATGTPHEPKQAGGAKRRKKEREGGQHQPLARGAAAAGGDAGAGAAVPPQLTCTSKVAEYTAGSGTGVVAEAAAAANTEQKRGKKKAKKDKGSKGDSRKGGDPSSRQAPPTSSSPGRAEKTATTSDESAAAVASVNDSDQNEDDGDDDGPMLEGVVHDGAIYLVDARRRVFSAQRDEQGNLVEVGTFDREGGKVVMTAQPFLRGAVAGGGDGAPAAAAAEGGASPSQHPVKPGGSKKKKGKGKGKGKGEGEGEGSEGGAGTEGAGPAETGNVVEYPFEVEECDHCETSERAYADIAPLLSALAAELGKSPEELAIYDPYYCQGSTVARLASLGFPRVYNRKEDFYEVVENGTIPEHDVVVTNPPFSGDHVHKILSFCARQGGKPWFLLMPNYVYLKDYYEASLGRGPGRAAALPFYLTPPKRYMYYSPAGSRLNVKSSERKTSPFNTFWYIRLGDGGVTSKILQAYDAVARKAESGSRCCVARTTQQIPYKMMDSNDPRRKKARDRQRSIDRIRKKKSEWAVSSG